MNEEGSKVCAINKAMEDLTKDINALDDKVNALQSHLNQVLCPELTITENMAGSATPPEPPASPLLQHMQGAIHCIGVIGRRVQRMIDRLEV
jgi:hypothetical protein